MTAEGQGAPSPNFQFLASHNPLLVELAARAERYCLHDPNAALVKLRQFAELLAQQVAAETGTFVDPQEGQRELLERLWQRGVLTAEVFRLFRDLRVVGNRAALELAAEAEQRLVERLAQYRVQVLAAEQQAAASASSDEITARIGQAQEAAEQLVDLDEQATRRLIDEQLREAGWEADTEALSYPKGVRPQKGRCLAIAEWPTRSGPADYVLSSGLPASARVPARSRAGGRAGHRHWPAGTAGCHGHRNRQDANLYRYHLPADQGWSLPPRAVPGRSTTTW